MTILLKSLSTDDNVDSFGQFEPLDTIASYTFSYDDTGNTYVTGTTVEQALDNIDTQMAIVANNVSAPRPMFNAYRSLPLEYDFGNAVAFGIATITHKIIFDVQLFDTHSAYLTTNGRFTAPITGVYHFCVQIGMDSLTWEDDINHSKTMVYKNGVWYTNVMERRGVFTEAYSGIYNIGNPEHHGGTINMELNQGDYIEIYNKRISYGGFGNTDKNRHIIATRESTWFYGYMIGTL